MGAAIDFGVTQVVDGVFGVSVMVAGRGIGKFEKLTGLDASGTLCVWGKC